MRRHLSTFLLVSILALGVFLRFYKLADIPNGLYQDETAIGYNAYAINTTGMDEYGKKFPLYFKSFGDYKLPVYVYLTALSERIFGVTAFAVRFPSALFGTLSILAFYFFITLLTKKNSMALIGAFILAINPWHLHYSRATFEVSVGLFLFLLGSICIAMAYEKRKGYFIAATVLFILALYTYNLTRLLSPLLFAIVVFFFHRKTHISKMEIWTSAGTALVLLYPFIQTFFNPEGVSSSLGTLIFTSAAVQAPLGEFRSYLATMPLWFTKVFFNSVFLTLWQYIVNIYAYFSVDFFFLHGSSHGNHGIGNMGLFYLIELPFMAVGFLTYLREKTKTYYFVILWTLSVICVAALTRESPHATRSFFLLVPYIILIARGVSWTATRIQNIKIPWQKAVFGTLIICTAGMNFIYYFSSYYVRFPIAYASAWRRADQDVSYFIAQNEKYYERIIIDRASGYIYSSLLFYTLFPPSEFQQTVLRLPDDSEGMSEVVSFGKYEFKDVTDADFLRPRTLIITKPDKKPEFAQTTQTFYYPKRPVVLALKQEILRFPIEDTAYIAVGLPSQ